MDSVRLGIRHGFTKNSQILGSLIYQDAKRDIKVPPVFSSNSELESYQFEIQHQYRTQKLQITVGASHRNNDQTGIRIQSFFIPFPPFPAETTTIDDAETTLTSGYIYGNIKVLEPLTLIVGGSIDDLEGRLVERKRFNPKFGLIWEPFPSTTLRASAFKTLQGPVFSKQNIQPSLEPTQVAGFNQFFFGSEGETTWRYGVAVDQQLSTTLFAGIEYSMRDLKTPFLDSFTVPGVNVIDEVDIDEDLVRTYILDPPPQISIQCFISVRKN